MYYLYHIPGKKIGVTRNLEERVHKQQGYKEGEYVILAESNLNTSFPPPPPAIIVELILEEKL